MIDLASLQTSGGKEFTSISRGKRCSSLMTGILRGISVPSIRELFHAYPAAKPVATKTSFVPLFSTETVIDLLINI